MATLTACEQAALDLAKYKGWREQLALGKVIEIDQADKRLRYAAGDINAVERLIRLKQAEVDKCNGVRSRGRFIRMTPSDDC